MGVSERLAEYGPHAHLVTVGEGGAPHVVSVLVSSAGGDRLVAGAGRTTAANVDRNPAVTLLWAAPAGNDYSLIVDGVAKVEGDSLTVEPTTAVLHRVATAVGDGPSCIRL